MPDSLVYILMGIAALFVLFATMLVVLMGIDIAWDIWEKRFGKGKR